MSQELNAAVRSLLVPVAPSFEREFYSFAGDYLLELGVAQADQPSWFAVQLRNWRETGSAGREFRGLVGRALFERDRKPTSFMFDHMDGPNAQKYEEAARRLSTDYFNLHRRLVEDHLFGHDAARQLLAHSSMIARLSIDERMTASEISRIMSVRDDRFELNWRAVRRILSSLGCAPAMELEEAKEIFRQDEDAEPILFGDLDLDGAIQKLSAVAADLGCPGTFDEWLRDLLLNDVHPPFLIMLHYQLMIQARYDHALTYVYEFSPRGEAVQWLTSQYREAHVHAGGNPFLNNAKATLRFDRSWTAGRTDSLRSASALSAILRRLENLSLLAKQELSAQIRALLHRNLRIVRERHGQGLPDQVPELDYTDAQRLLAAVAAENTQTTGIIEQRLVDCYGILRHPTDGGWVAKGIGDSVFAANTYRRKFGDCEFVLPKRGALTITAYEAHGGRLTLPYIEDHLHSLRQVVRAREEELATIEPLSRWSVNIVFVAHDVAEGLPQQGEVSTNVGDLTVIFKYETFGEVAKFFAGNKNSVEVLNRGLVGRVNSFFVHHKVRRKLNSLVSREVAGIDAV